jgi:acyl carrier protein
MVTGMSILSGQAWDIVQQAVITVLDVPSTQLEQGTRFADDLGADSLAMVEIVEVSEEQLRKLGIFVWVEDDSLAGLTVLGDLVSVLQNAKEK